MRGESSNQPRCPHKPFPTFPNWDAHASKLCFFVWKQAPAKSNYWSSSSPFKPQEHFPCMDNSPLSQPQMDQWYPKGPETHQPSIHVIISGSLKKVSLRCNVYVIIRDVYIYIILVYIWYTITYHIPCTHVYSVLLCCPTWSTLSDHFGEETAVYQHHDFCPYLGHVQDGHPRWLV